MPNRTNEVRFLLLAVVLHLVIACQSSTPPALAPARAAAGERAEEGPLFSDVTGAVGLGEEAQHWPDGTFFLPEVMGPGVALFDFDGDGDLDILQVRMPPPGEPRSPAPKRLFEQQSGGTFHDVTEQSGIGDPGYGQGVAIGDTDNDGDLDVYFANYGPDAFYRNEGNGKFSNVTAEAGFSGDSWSSSAAFLDYDRDGDLDLFVAHYLRLRPSARCLTTSGEQDYCGPRDFDGVPDTLYRNNGNGTFTDVSNAAGIRYADGGRKAKGLGVVCADVTGDGWIDVWVANDGEANHLWINHGDGTFTEEGILRGVAVNRHGSPEAGMGVAAGDADGDGRLDLFVTHLANENNTLYRALSGMLFNDVTVEAGMASDDLPLTGFGTGFFDFDHDGDLDLAVVNGRVKRGRLREGGTLGRFWMQYAEPNLLFENDGRGRFSNVSDRSGPFATSVEVSRGLAFGDIDRDGDLDLVVSSVGNALRLFRNEMPKRGRHWLIVRTMTGRRDAERALVVVSASGKRYARSAAAAYSYMSSSDPRAHFGLGEARAIDRIEVFWPSGRREEFSAPGVDRELTLTEGSGRSE